MAPFGLEYKVSLHASGYFLSFLSNYCLNWIETFHKCSLSLNLLGRVRKVTLNLLRGELWPLLDLESQS